MHRLWQATVNSSPLKEGILEIEFLTMKNWKFSILFNGMVLSAEKEVLTSELVNLMIFWYTRSSID